MDECNLWLRLIQQFRDSCTSFDGLWIKRRRRFDTETMVKSLIRLVGGGLSSYHSVLSELSGPSMAASSFCEARGKFPAFLIGEIRRDLLEKWDDASKLQDWHGFYPHAVDGSKIALPRSLFNEGFIAPASGYCPQGLISVLVRVSDRMICDVRLSKMQNERAEAHDHLDQLSAKDLVIYDRGYLSFALLTAHTNRKIDAVFRVQEGTSFNAIQSFWNDPKNDTVVTIEPTSVTIRNASKNYPEYELRPLTIRLIKYQIDGKKYVLATTILDTDIPTQDFVSLYANRWTATEETFKSLKQTLDLEDFHSKTENGISQEVEAAALLWNLARMAAKPAESSLKKKLPMFNIIALPTKHSPNIALVCTKTGLHAYRRQREDNFRAASLTKICNQIGTSRQTKPEISTNFL